MTKSHIYMHKKVGDCCDMRGLLGFLILFLLSKKPMHGQELAADMLTEKAKGNQVLEQYTPPLKILKKWGLS